MSDRFKDQSITFANGSVGEDVSFTSANLSDYADAMANAPSLAPVEIDAKLFMPPKPARDPLPLVVVVPGSVGVAVSHLSHAETVTELGMAALVIDPFGARQVTSTVSNQTQYSFAASAYDVVAAIKYAATLSGIDTQRIGTQGHSRGGSAVLTAAMTFFSGQDLPLKAVYSVYPWCGHQFLNPDIGDVALRIVIGDQDNWCSPQQAQGYAQAIRLAGGRVSFRLFEDAEHSFDRQPPIETEPDAKIAPHAPIVYIDDHGVFIDPWTGKPDAALTDRDLMIAAMKAGFGVTGASLGGKGDQPQAFKDDMSRFWTAHLLAP